jgi:putative inorganic carbon (HCO3(-)) transporter
VVPSIDVIWLGIAGFAGLLALACLAWRISPAYIFATGVVLTPISGNWQAMGIPGPLAMDRLLIVTAIGVTLLRELTRRRESNLRLEPVHWLLAAVLVYAVISAMAVGTVLESDSFFRLLQIYGALPFLTFLTAPLVFRDRRDRQILLVAFVGLGAYLGLTALFETVKLDALVFPKYILDPNVGTHFDRARGPFAEAVTNGMALFTCAVAAAIAFATWRDRARRILAASVVLLCLFGTFVTLQRSVWVATVLATAVVIGTTRELRRLALPLIGVAVAMLVGALVLIPGLAGHAEERKNDAGTVWDRENANRAAINMVDSHPLFGLGWGEFDKVGIEYFELSSDHPLSRTAVHNLFLGLAAELGLVGVTLWVCGFLFAIGGAILARPPPELKPWWIGLIAIATFYVVVVNFVPPVVFPNLIIWLWAGVVWAGRVPSSRRAAVPVPSLRAPAQARS